MRGESTRGRNSHDGRIRRSVKAAGR
jgi:hypothetical protein